MRRPFRRPNRRAVRFATRMLGRARRNRSFLLSQALRAFDRSIRAHKRLIKLAPRMFDPVVMRREQQRRDEDEKLRQMWEPALRKAYGDAAVDSTPWPSNHDSPIPKCPRTRAAMDRMVAEKKLWLELGGAALTDHQKRHPQYLPSLTMVARLIETAFMLGRIACGMPLEIPPPEPKAEPMPNMLEDLERIYGKSEPEAAPSPG